MAWHRTSKGDPKKWGPHRNWLAEGEEECLPKDLQLRNSSEAI